MLSSSQEMIIKEENSLQDSKGVLKSIKSKWFKTTPKLRLISFLEYYCGEKEKFINQLKKFKNNGK